MPFSQKLRPGFDLRFLLPGGRGRAGNGGAPGRLDAARSLTAIAIAFSLAGGTPWAAHAGPSPRARLDPGPVAQVTPAPEVPDTPSDPAASDTASGSAAPGAYAEPPRARRRAPRPSAEIRSEARVAPGRAPATAPP